MTVTAAWALQDFIQGKSSQQPVVVSKPTVVPAIVLIDSKQEDIDRNLKEKHPIKIIRIPNTQVISSILKADKEGLEKYARNILNIDKIKPKTEGDIAERGILGIKSRTPQKNREGDAAI